MWRFCCQFFVICFLVFCWCLGSVWVCWLRQCVCLRSLVIVGCCMIVSRCLCVWVVGLLLFLVRICIFGVSIFVFSYFCFVQFLFCVEVLKVEGSVRDFGFYGLFVIVLFFWGGRLEGCKFDFKIGGYDGVDFWWLIGVLQELSCLGWRGFFLFCRYFSGFFFFVQREEMGIFFCVDGS